MSLAGCETEASLRHAHQIHVDARVDMYQYKIM